VLVRLKRMETPIAERRPIPQRPPREPRAARSPLPKRQRGEAKTAATQWVWLLDEEKLQDRGNKPETPAEPDVDDETPDAPPAGGGPRRRRRRRGGARPSSEPPAT
jgi:hypothetical protein